MSAVRALAWKEARQLRSNVIALAVFAVGGPLLPILADVADGGDDAHRAVVLTTVAVIALLLGATARAGDGAPAFEAMQPLARTTTTLVRLGLRVALLAAIAPLTALSGLAVAHRGAIDPPQGAPAWTLLPWLAAPLFAAALSSAFRDRPIEAALDSLWIFPLATLITMPALAVSPGWWGALTSALLGGLAFLAITARLQGRPVRRILGRIVLVAAGVAIAVLALWLVVGGLLATASLQRAQATWEAEVGRLDASDRFPGRAANEAGRRLDELVAPLGISLAPKRATEAPSREPEDVARGRRAVEAHLRAVVDAPRPRAVEAPADVVAFLAAHEAELEAVRAHVLASDVPSQAVSIEGGIAAPIPNPLGHFRLQKLLLCDAIVAARTGESDRARADMACAIRINEGLRVQPSLIAQFVATASARHEVAVLRLLDEHDAAALLSAIDVAAWRDALWRAHGVETWAFLRAADADLSEVAAASGARPPASRAERLFLPVIWALLRPGMRMVAASRVEDSARLMAAAGRESACDLVFGIGNQSEPSSAAARWFPMLAAFSPPDPRRALTRGALLELEAELSRAVIAARTARSTDPLGAWPTALPEASSRTCPGEHWRYATTPDGGITLSPWKTPRGLDGGIEPRLSHAE